MREIKCVQIDVDSDMDADDLGQRITDCVKDIVNSNSFINLVKVHLVERLSKEQAHAVLKQLHSSFIELGATNCILVPIGDVLGIKDITVNKIDRRNNGE